MKKLSLILFIALMGVAVSFGQNSKTDLLRSCAGSFEADLVIEPLTGERTISTAIDVFTSYIDTNFKNFGLDKPGSATPEISLDVREMIGDGTFFEIFAGIQVYSGNPLDLDKIAMTQAQIIRFCEKYPNWLCQEGSLTLFLTRKKLNFLQTMCRVFNKNEEYFMVGVFVHSVGLSVHVYRLGRGGVWCGGCRYRVVSPQLGL
jgi:hypothetical protein